MQGTTNFHDVVTYPRAQETTDVFDNATALDTAIDMFDGDPTARQRLIGCLLLSG